MSNQRARIDRVRSNLKVDIRVSASCRLFLATPVGFALLR
jgi:hypothetical protein